MEDHRFLFPSVAGDKRTFVPGVCPPSVDPVYLLVIKLRLPVKVYFTTMGSPLIYYNGTFEWPTLNHFWEYPMSCSALLSNDPALRSATSFHTNALPTLPPGRSWRPVDTEVCPRLEMCWVDGSCPIFQTNRRSVSDLVSITPASFTSGTFPGCVELGVEVN